MSTINKLQLLVNLSLCSKNPRTRTYNFASHPTLLRQAIQWVGSCEMIQNLQLAASEFSPKPIRSGCVKALEAMIHVFLK